MTSKISFRHICSEDTYMFNYTQLPDDLFTVEHFSILSLEAKVLYSFMLRRISLSKQNKWIDEYGDVYIYYRVDEIIEKLNCSNKTAAKIMSELEKIGLIEKRRQGQGKPDIIYVNKFNAVIEVEDDEEDDDVEGDEEVRDEEEISEMNKLHVKKCKNYTSKDVKSTSLEVKNLHANYIDNSNKELVNPSSTSPPDSAREQVRLLEEEEEEYRKRLKYQEAEQKYSVQIAIAVYAELLKRDITYRSKFTADMFHRVCRSISVSKEPIVYMPGLINWCLDNISFSPQNKNATSERNNPCGQFNQFMQTDYDFDAIERELLAN